MDWYEGSIEDAINLQIATGAVFVCLIKGDDEKSEYLAWYFDQDPIVERLGTGKFVAYQMLSIDDSPDFQYFQSMFKDIEVPSVYFIDSIGTVLYIVRDPLLSVERFISLIYEIEEHLAEWEDDCTAPLQLEPCEADFTQNVYFQGCLSAPCHWIVYDILDTVVDQAVCSAERMSHDAREYMTTQWAVGSIMEHLIKDTIYKSEVAPEWDDTEAFDAYGRRQRIRIHFCMPTSVEYLHDFQRDNLLSEVFDYVESDVIPWTHFKAFDLCLAFPKVEFQKEDYVKTLHELSLTSGCKMLVLEEKIETLLPPPSSWFLSILGTCAKPIKAVFNGIKYLAENLSTAHDNFMQLQARKEEQREHEAEDLAAVQSIDLDKPVFGVPLRDYRSFLYKGDLK